ncbi:MAG: VOC family protein [Kurthia sp.]|uniref:Glyoxalase-like protein n=1 Tax=Kurthia zopfii TaxID=1650 RepID=A0A8B4QDP3_9BACL|nr:VOC family protein [Kurthia zopfii]PWI23285.1 VOC family protein [Kurthia zopfii]TDR42148.1 glyoxalase-like protein [Kurthia zopfii]GEK29915.1 hypothetical protein KZO01_02240 [Kurthia zopfii]STX10933.1 Uncharacterised protein [Kurthia zopfii]
MFELDHVVYFTKRSPEEVVEKVEIEKVHPVIGGQHLQWGTHNALFYTKSSYIEWLSIEDLEKARHTNHPLIKQLLYDVDDRDGFASICLRSDNLEQMDKYFSKMGYKTSGVLPSERKTADGEVIRWKMLFIDQKVDESLPYPFFIEWEKDTEERYSALRESGAVKEANEELTINKCKFHVHDVEKKLTQWSRLLSLPFKDNQLKLSNTKFEFIESNDEKERLQTVEVVKSWTIE